MKSIFLLLISILWIVPTFGLTSEGQLVSFIQSKKECFSGSGSVSWRYCVHKPADGKTNGNLAYLFHGRNLDENTWNDAGFYTGMIQQYWQKNNIIPPIVVSVSFGPIWLLTERGQQPKSGLLSFFTNEVIREVESKVGKPKYRIVFGESMGGLNALVLGLKAGDLFSKVASSCPAVYKLSPFASTQETQEFLERTGADSQVVQGVVQLAKEFIADEGEWQNFSPLELVKKTNFSNGPQFYLSSGLYDVYGNYEGNELLAQSVTAAGGKMDWRPLYGGHCVMDISSLADFLAR
jgi:S-formylglutathione hydrolase FrmB